MYPYNNLVIALFRLLLGAETLPLVACSFAMHLVEAMQPPYQILF